METTLTTIRPPIIIYILSRYYLRKTELSRFKKSLFTFLLTLFGSMMFLTMFIMPNLKTKYCNFDINKEIFWKQKPSERYKIVECLIESKILLQKDTNFIKQILIDPDGVAQDKSDWKYNIRTLITDTSTQYHYLILNLKGNKVNSAKTEIYEEMK